MTQQGGSNQKMDHQPISVNKKSLVRHETNEVWGQVIWEPIYHI